MLLFLLLDKGVRTSIDVKERGPWFNVSAGSNWLSLVSSFEKEHLKLSPSIIYMHAGFPESTDCIITC